MPEQAPIEPPNRVALDEVDLRIVSLLVQDGRLSTRAIAREIGMSPGAISDRIDRLERDGVIAGYAAKIDFNLLGYTTSAIIGLRIQHGYGLVSEVMERLTALQQVTKVRLVTGPWDILVEVSAHDQTELREFLVSGVWQIPGFMESSTMVVLDAWDNPRGPSVI